MDDDQFIKPFKYIEDFRKEVTEKFEVATHDRADIRGTIGELSAQVRDYHDEMMAGSHQTDKLWDAISQTTEETGVALSVEL